MPHALFCSYLSSRKQTVINEMESDALVCDIRAPLGSVLGPSHFNLYLNDMCGCLENCEVNLRLNAEDALTFLSWKDHS